jgi:bacillopeptidase F (M6 metalloprotease family)
VGGYANTFTAGVNLCGVAPQSGGFTSTNQLTWRQSQVALGAYAGQTVQLRWLYRSDGATNGQGWFVDDIALTHAMVPGPCTTDAETLLIDGFE